VTLETRADLPVSDTPAGRTLDCVPAVTEGEVDLSLGTILLIILVIFLLGGFSGRFGGYGYGFGHGGVGVIGVLLIVVLVLLLTGRL
jgi:hypothetical protein